MERLVITGSYEHQIYKNNSTGYTVFTIKTDNIFDEKYMKSSGDVTCSGYIPTYTQGIPLKATGYFSKYKNSYTFQIQSIEEDFSSKKNLINYLSSAEFTGIGPKKAEKIVELFSPDLFEASEKEDALDKMMRAGLDRDKAIDTIAILKKAALEKALIHDITECGGTIEEALKIPNMLGEKAKEKLYSNPYLVFSNIGSKFGLADTFAKKIGLSHVDKVRIKSILVEALKKNESQGNTCCSFNELYSLCRRIESSGAYTEKVPKMLYLTQIQAFDSTIIVKETNDYNIYLTHRYKEELNIVRQLDRLKATARPFPFKEEYIDKVSEEMSMLFFDEQRNAFHILENSSPCILTGGPGRGKTTLIRGIIDIYEEIFPKDKIVLCAPTGRASQRLVEATGRAAFTMHKVLDIRPYKNDNGRTEYTMKDETDPIDASVIVIDEFSMVDTHLFSAFLSAVPSSCLLILVGDENQLPSVGCGNVLHDLINSETIRTFRLTSIFRQLEGSTIIQNSEKILHHDTNIVSGEDFALIRCKNAKEMVEKVIELHNRLYDNKNIYRTQILTTTRKGLCGTVELNKKIQEALRDTNMSGLRRFCIGDKIMTERNNYNADEDGGAYFNGDMGTVIDVSKDYVRIALDIGCERQEFELDRETIDDLSLADSITVHKSQGSEFDTTIIVLPKSPQILLTNYLLYTAVTRAKKRVAIFYEDDALYTAIHNDTRLCRKTGLEYKLRQGLKK